MTFSVVDAIAHHCVRNCHKIIHKLQHLRLLATIPFPVGIAVGRRLNLYQ